jgi:hypothetical protein
MPTQTRPIIRGLAFCLLLAGCGGSPIAQTTPPQQDWAHHVRIGAYGLQSHNAREIVRDAQASGVFGIEVDNDIPGRYESFLHPEAKLKAIRAVAREAHRVGNYTFVYIAGTECITAHADRTTHTLAKDHPAWLQRKRGGEPAIFGGGTAFWIAPGDEDVWISPYATEWRKIYMQRVRQIAQTGIDGIYVDIPYWMTHFDGWEDSWASFDDATVAAFKAETGLDAKRDVKLGDFNDPGFRQWIEFRTRTITEFLREIDQTAKAVNPRIKTIPEIYPGIEEESVRVGADVYSLYPVVDAVAHEYEFGGGDHMASSRSPLEWFQYQVGMHSFRAFAEGKPTWILNYSWDGDKNVDARESMMNLAMSQVMAGANFWDAPGHSMAGSNDLPTRKAIFNWIKDHEVDLFSPREPVDPVGVYFSPQSRNLHPKEFLASYRGVLIFLMQQHVEFQIVTPRTLASFRGRALVLPHVTELDRTEQQRLSDYSRHGKLIAMGEGALNLRDSPSIVRVPADAGAAYSATLEAGFAQAIPGAQLGLVSLVPDDQIVQVRGGPQVATSVARVNGMVYCYFANFAGLRGGSNPIQTPQTGFEVSIAAKSPGSGFFLPFMGTVQKLTGSYDGGRSVFTLPTITRGAVFWFRP